METLNVLHLEDSETDALLVRRSLEKGGLKCNIRVVSTLTDYRQALNDTSVDAVLADSAIPGISPLQVLEVARDRRRELPLIYVSGSMDERVAVKALEAGATGFVAKMHLERLPALLRSSTAPWHQAETPTGSGGGGTPMQLLLTAACDLAGARSLHEILFVVKRAARRLTGSDGVAVILREGEKVFYAEEDAVRPLWKGRHFPIDDDIAGWSMLQKKTVVIPDVTRDDRVAVEMYGPTFVHSLLIVPVGRENPLAAIASYWSEEHRQDLKPEAKRLLETLAELTASAMDTVTQLARRDRQLAADGQQIQQLNTELEDFTQAVASDLQAPLHSLRGFCVTLEIEQGERMTPEIRKHFAQIMQASDGLLRHTENLVELAALSRTDLSMQEVNLSNLVQAGLSELQRGDPKRQVQVEIEKGLKVRGDVTLLRRALGQLLQNAWTFTERRDRARIEFSSVASPVEGQRHFVVRDNGSGFAGKDAARLFAPFFRAHADRGGAGLGLAIVRRIVALHGGTVWAEGLPELGAAFHFTLPETPGFKPVREAVAA